MDVVTWLNVIAGVIIQLAIITALLRGAYRAYPMLLVIIVANLLGTVASMAAFIGMEQWTPYAARVYWLCEATQYMLIFAFQAHLLSQGWTGPGARRRIGYLVVGGLCFVVLAAWSAHHARLNLWMTQLIRNVSFGSMMLNLALWTTLLRNPDRCRLLITAAVGILLAGGAVGHSLRQISHSLVPAGNVVLIGTYLLYLFLLWRSISRYWRSVPSGAPSAALHPAG